MLWKFGGPHNSIFFSELQLNRSAETQKDKGEAISVP